MYELIQQSKLREIEMQAAFHGVEINGSSVSSSSKVAENPKVPMFRDPEEYESMSPEEREEETTRMMGLHKTWSGDAINKKPDLQGPSS